MQFASPTKTADDSGPDPIPAPVEAPAPEFLADVVPARSVAPGPGLFARPASRPGAARRLGALRRAESIRRDGVGGSGAEGAGGTGTALLERPDDAGGPQPAPDASGPGSGHAAGQPTSDQPTGTQPTSEQPTSEPGGGEHATGEQPAPPEHAPGQPAPVGAKPAAAGKAEVPPAVQAARTEFERARAAVLPDLTVCVDAGKKRAAAESAALEASKQAKAAFAEAKAAWGQATAGVTVAEKSDGIKALSAAAAKARTDAKDASEAAATAFERLTKQANIDDVLARLDTQKKAWNATDPAVAAAAADLDAEAKALRDSWADARNAAATADSTLAAITAAADEAAKAYTDSLAPLEPGRKLYAVVGQMQQKLNDAGAEPELSVTGRFDQNTAHALEVFQMSHHLAEAGVADGATWKALDAVAPNVKRVGQTRVGNGDKAQTGTPSGSVHPKVDAKSSGAAVVEVQQKLNNWCRAAGGKTAALAVPVTGKFDAKTEALVKAFQSAKKVKATGEVDAATWTALDTVAGAVTEGARDFRAAEVVEGKLYGIHARYEYAVDLKGRRLVITVKLNFTGFPSDPSVTRWIKDIKDVWNNYRAVEVGGSRQFDIEFDPVVSADGTTVQVCKPAKPTDNPRSDAGHWYTNDTRKGLAPHEFGHLIGLDDEYNRSEEDYTAVTGEQASVGSLNSASGASPEELLKKLEAVIANNKQGTAFTAAMKSFVATEDFKKGGLARLVGNLYVKAHGYPADFKKWAASSGTPLTFVTYVRWLCDAGNTAAFVAGGGSAGDLVDITEPFTESNRSIMGTMESVPQGSDQATIRALPPHDHPVQPRHVRVFLPLLAQAMPKSRWKVQPR